MSKFSLAGAATALFCAGAGLLPAPTEAQKKAAVPDFTVDDKSAWLMIGDDPTRVADAAT
jgi:hypothetical protein